MLSYLVNCLRRGRKAVKSLGTWVPVSGHVLPEAHPLMVGKSQIHLPDVHDVQVGGIWSGGRVPLELHRFRSCCRILACSRPGVRLRVNNGLRSRKSDLGLAISSEAGQQLDEPLWESEIFLVEWSEHPIEDWEEVDEVVTVANSIHQVASLWRPLFGRVFIGPKLCQWIGTPVTRGLRKQKDTWQQYIVSAIPNANKKEGRSRSDQFRVPWELLKKSISVQNFSQLSWLKGIEEERIVPVMRVRWVWWTKKFPYRYPKW